LERPRPDDLKNSATIIFRCTSFRDLLANIAQGAVENHRTTTAGPMIAATSQQVPPFCKSKICERRKVLTTPLAARLYEPNFYSDEPLPDTNKYPPFWEFSTPGTLGLSFANVRPATVTGNWSEKAHGAPFSWETFNRSKPQHELTTDRIGGMFRKAIYPHSHFHIYASLPGLNDPAFMRRGVPPLCNVVKT